jgi:hypothetical protein
VSSVGGTCTGCAAESMLQLQGVEYRLSAKMIVGDEIGLLGLPANALDGCHEFLDLPGVIPVVIPHRTPSPLLKLCRGIAAMQAKITDGARDHLGQSNRVRHLRLIDVADADAQLLQELIDLRQVSGAMAHIEDQRLRLKGVDQPA